MARIFLKKETIVYKKDKKVMKYGCIGEHLKHSFSKEIHNALTDYEYEIKEVASQKLAESTPSE